MSEQFFFQLSAKTYSGVGRSRKLGELLAENGWKRALILVDEAVATTPYYSEVTNAVKAATAGVEQLIVRGSEEPDYDYLDELVAEARGMAELDVVVGIGGGSCMDVAKCVAALLTNPGPGLDYRGFDLLTIPAKPSVLVPTTAGTGSEVTINAAIIEKSEKRKLGINGRYMTAAYGILDAEWTMSCPQHAAVGSGMDALVHALESYSCKQHNTMTRMFSREAFRLLYKNLPALMDDPESREPRQQLLIAAYIAAAGLFNSGSGIAAAISYPIGTHYGVPHGIGGGMFIADECEFNVERGYEDYAELLDLVEENPGMNAAEKSRRFIEALRELCAKLGVPANLTQWGITSQNVEQAAALLPVMQAGFDQNPYPFDAEADGLAILKKHVE